MTRAWRRFVLFFARGTGKHRYEPYDDVGFDILHPWGDPHP